MNLVYKLTREDNLCYIGLTLNLKKRIYEHKRSVRFKELKIINIEILGKYSVYSDAEEAETNFIKEYDTFYHGLNYTPDGKGKNKFTKFNTFGLTHNVSTKEKIGYKSKERNAGKILQEYFDTPEGKIKKQELNQKHSEFKKTIFYPAKFNETIITSVYELYNSNPTIKGDDLIGKNGKNGKKINYLTLFVNEYSQKFNMTTAYMRKLLKGKVLVWKYLYEEILDMKS